MSDRSVQRFAKTVVGTSLDFLLPGLMAEDGQRGESGQGGHVKLKSWVIQSRLERAYWRGDTNEIERLQHCYWQADVADHFYDRYRNRYEKWFLGLHHRIVEALAAETADRRFHRLVEVGCGDGRVLDHLSRRLDGIDEFVGLDINPTIIARNKAAYARDLKLSFVLGNASDVLEDCLRDNTVLFTYGGVLEYFTSQKVARLFGQLGQRTNTAVALVEPVDPAHDLDRDTHSHIFGAEHSFSHNHRHLLQSAGYQVSLQHEIQLGGVRWILVLARKDQGSVYEFS